MRTFSDAWRRPLSRRRPAMRPLRLLSCGVAMVLLGGLAACGGDNGAAGKSGANGKTSVSIMYFQPSASYLPVFVAVDGGYFAKQGIDAKLELTQNTEAVASPAYDFTMTGDTEIVNAAAEGVHLKVLAAEVDRPVFKVMAAKDITNGQQLRGKKIATFKPGAVARYVTEKFLQSAGLSQSDVDLTVIPQQPTAFAALKSGAVDAATLVAPFDLNAVHAGYNVVYDPVKANLYGAMSQLVSREDYIKSHPETVQKVVTAFVEATRRTLNDEAFAVKVLMKHTGVPEQAARNAYQEFHDVWEANPKKNPKALQSIIAYTAEVNPKAASLKPQTMIDSSFLEKALGKLGRR